MSFGHHCPGELSIIIIWATGLWFWHGEWIINWLWNAVTRFVLFYDRDHGKRNLICPCFLFENYVWTLFNDTLFCLLFSMISWQPGKKSDELCMFLLLMEWYFILVYWVMVLGFFDNSIRCIASLEESDQYYEELFFGFL